MNMVPLQHLPGSSGAQHFSRIECSGCHTTLMYPPYPPQYSDTAAEQGSANVRCARCGTITPSLPQAVAGNDMAQLTCTNQNCRLPLMYPRGARQVQCSVCGTLNDSMASNSIGHIICGMCRITLMYAYGAQSVKCAVCNHVTPADPSGSGQPPHGGPLVARQNSSGPSKPPTHTIVVENPTTLDEHGNEVQHFAVGTTQEPQKAPATGSQA